MDFILGFPRTQMEQDSVTAVNDRFSKITYFIVCYESDNASHITQFKNHLPEGAIPRQQLGSCVRHFIRSQKVYSINFLNIFFLQKTAGRIMPTESREAGPWP